MPQGEQSIEEKRRAGITPSSSASCMDLNIAVAISLRALIVTFASVEYEPYGTTICICGYARMDRYIYDATSKTYWIYVFS